MDRSMCVCAYTPFGCWNACSFYIHYTIDSCGIYTHSGSPFLASSFFFVSTLFVQFYLSFYYIILFYIIMFIFFSCLFPGTHTNTKCTLYSFYYLPYNDCESHRSEFGCVADLPCRRKYCAFRLVYGKQIIIKWDEKKERSSSHTVGSLGTTIPRIPRIIPFSACHSVVCEKCKQT